MCDHRHATGAAASGVSFWRSHRAATWAFPAGWALPQVQRFSRPWQARDSHLRHAGEGFLKRPRLEMLISVGPVPEMVRTAILCSRCSNPSACKVPAASGQASHVCPSFTLPEGRPRASAKSSVTATPSPGTPSGRPTRPGLSMARHACASRWRCRTERCRSQVANS